MEDLLQSQIQNSCRLALPNGLKELMSDISREVLRKQPTDLLKFITDYLSTLLVTRENLYIAAQVCDDVCDCDCRSELDDELRYIGLDEQATSDATKIVENFLGIGEINEEKLLLKLVRKTSIDDSQVSAVQAAIRRAFLKHQRNHTKIFETSSSDSDEDAVARAARHTLMLYRKTDPTPETFNCMANKIQASYRAYQVRRETGNLRSVKTDQLSGIIRSESFKSTDQVATGNTDQLAPSRTDISEKRKVVFGGSDQEKGGNASGQTQGTSDIEDKEDSEVESTYPQKKRKSANQVSSTSLAGSYLSLPQYMPYSAHDHDTFVGLEETPEKERSNYDYTRENSLIDKRVDNNMTEVDEEQRYRKISFYDSPIEDKFYGEIDEESVIDELIVEEDVSAEDIVEDIVGTDGSKLTDIVEEDHVEEYDKEFVKEDDEDYMDDPITDTDKAEGIVEENIKESIVYTGILKDHMKSIK